MLTDGTPGTLDHEDAHGVRVGEIPTLFAVKSVAIGVDGAAGVVEVRRGQRRVGVEPDRLEVVAL